MLQFRGRFNLPFPGGRFGASAFQASDKLKCRYRKALRMRHYVGTLIRMDITFDPSKREKTLTERGLDFALAGEVFAGRTLTLTDDRFDYGETRFQSYGFLAGRVVMVVWTQRGEARHIISMRHCHERESRRVIDRMG